MTTDIKLRSIYKKDYITVQRMFLEFNASEFGKYDPIDHTDASHVIAFLDQMTRNHVIYAVARADSDEMIGYVCFHILGDEYDIGYMISSQYHRAGIATAASRMAIEKLRKERGASVFTATVVAENHPSVRVLEKLGFSLVAETCLKKEENGMESFLTERRYAKYFL